MHHGFACVFPGQGSQSVGMLQSFAADYPSIVQSVFDEAANALQYDLWSLVANGPEATLNKTEITQPALLASSVAIWRIWQMQQGPQPAMMAGHSLGEYTALVCANAMSFSDAIRLVALRGRLMQAAVPEGQGAMAAIVGLTDAQVATVCESVAATGIVVPANFNAIGQVVISGEKAAVEAAIVVAKEQGAKLAKMLTVSVPSHSPLMKPAADELAKALSDITLSTPEIPVIHNVNVRASIDPQEIKQWLIEQLYKPVRWVETIQLFVNEGYTTIVECGPGRVLAGLCKRIEANANGVALHQSDAVPLVLHLLEGE